MIIKEKNTSAKDIGRDLHEKIIKEKREATKLKKFTYGSLYYNSVVALVLLIIAFSIFKLGLHFIPICIVSYFWLQFLFFIYHFMIHANFAVKSIKDLYLFYYIAYVHHYRNPADLCRPEHHRSYCLLRPMGVLLTSLLIPISMGYYSESLAIWGIGQFLMITHGWAHEWYHMPKKQAKLLVRRVYEFHKEDQGLSWQCHKNSCTRGAYSNEF